LTDILASLENAAPRDKTNLDSLFRDVVQTFPKRGLMILLSDLLGAEESSLRGIDTLRRAGHDVMVLHILDDDELDFPFSDPTRFEGLESDDHLTCNPRALREGYLQALERFLDRVRRACAASKSDYLLIRTSDAPDAVLSKILSDRLHTVRR
jgi:glycine/D-amino acid oxidase-like deaminating enzyme